MIIYIRHQVQVHIIFFSESSKHWTNSHIQALPTSISFFKKPSVISTPLHVLYLITKTYWQNS